MPHGTPPRALPVRIPRSRTGKWVRARYVAEFHEIKRRYVEWEIIGPPEIRDVDPGARYFSPHVILRQDERAPELQPMIDALEAFLVRLFLRRYVTYYARRGRFAAMNGAARLFAEGERVARRADRVETTSLAGAGPAFAQNWLLLAEREAETSETKAE